MTGIARMMIGLAAGLAGLGLASSAWPAHAGGPAQAGGPDGWQAGRGALEWAGLEQGHLAGEAHGLYRRRQCDLTGQYLGCERLQRLGAALERH